MKKFLFILIFLISVNLIVLPQSRVTKSQLIFPDIDEYKTLKCDFHIHTVFSDGLVWPDFRVSEAIQDGLDAIAITDHIEYRPHKEFLTGDLNTSSSIARKEAKYQNFIVIKGAEITRKMPPGHINAIFLNDVNPLETDDVVEAVKAAYEQGAFIFWNHPCWKAQQPDTVVWFDIHTELYSKGYIHGIELVNFSDFCPEAWKWAKEKNLTILSNSDIHGTTNTSEFVKHRPITLVFAHEFSEEAIKEALFARRTLAYYDEKIFGEKQWLEKLFKNSLKIEKHNNPDIQRTFYEITNLSSVPIILKPQNNSLVINRIVPKIIEIPPLSKVNFDIRYKNYSEQKVKFDVKTFIYDIDKYLEFELDVK
jgi:hypothetical protein